MSTTAERPQTGRRVDYHFPLWPKQQYAFESPATELLFGGAAGPGKAATLDTPIQTIHGARPLRDVQVGDWLVSPTGGATQIVALSEIVIAPVYTVHFDDGTTARCHEDHLWAGWRTGKSGKRNATRVNGAKALQCYTTREICEFTEKAKNATRRKEWFAIPLVQKPLQFTRNRFKGDAYLLGALLGDGCFTTGNLSLCASWKDYEEHWRPYLNQAGLVHSLSKRPGIAIMIFRGETRAKLEKWLRNLKLYGTKGAGKFAPESLRYSPENIRTALLQGLLDTDGSTDAHGYIEFTNISRNLTDTVAFIIRSLGGRATIAKPKCGSYRDNEGRKINCQFVYRLHGRLPKTIKPFRLARKQELFEAGDHKQSWSKKVIDVTVGEPEPMRCIQVRKLDGLYCINDCTVTHNSHLIRVALIQWCFEIPGLQCYLFRRIYDDLIKNHMEGDGSFVDLLAEAANDGLVTITTKRIAFFNGSRIYLNHLQYDKHLRKYQGTAFHVLCCEVNERARMADGREKRMIDLRAGDFIETLQGPRRIVRVTQPRLEQCVRAETRTQSQMQGINHKLLTSVGWVSYADMSNALRLSSTCESKVCHDVRKSVSPSWPPYPCSGRRLAIRNVNPALILKPARWQQGHQREWEIYDDKEQGELGIAAVSWPDSRARDERLASSHRIPVVLAEQKRQSAEAIPCVAGLPLNVPEDAGNDSTRADWRSYCQTLYHSRDARPQTEAKIVLSDVPSQDGVAEQNQRNQPWDDGETVPRHTPDGRRRYDHPYTGEAFLSEVETAVENCDLIPCGRRWVVDLTVEETNHYITRGGFVNQNCIDELTHFTDQQYRYLRGRVRMTEQMKARLPKRYYLGKRNGEDEYSFPRILTGSNPGSEGHVWAKKTFVTPGPWTIYRQPDDEGGMLRQFVPALMSDNPSLNRAEYEKKLSGLGDPVLIRALKEGDWSIAEGAMFGETWRATQYSRPWHVHPGFAIPNWWPLWRGADDGYSEPFAGYWGTEDPKYKTIYVIDELYKTRMLPEEVARRVKERDRNIQLSELQGRNFVDAGFNQEILKGAIDNSAFTDPGESDKEGEKVITRGDQMNKLGLRWTPVQKWPGSKIAGIKNFHRLLAPNPKAPLLYNARGEPLMDKDGNALHDRPGIVFFQRCVNVIEHIPALPRNKQDMEDIAEVDFDHSFDGVRYLVQFRRGKTLVVDVTG